MVTIKSKKRVASYLIQNSPLIPKLFCFYCHHCCNQQWLERAVVRRPEALASSDQPEALPALPLKLRTVELGIHLDGKPPGY